MAKPGQAEALRPFGGQSDVTDKSVQVLRRATAHDFKSATVSDAQAVVALLWTTGLQT